MASRPLAVNDVMRVSAYVAQENQVSVNTVHWLVTSVGGTPSTDQDLADAQDSLYSPFYAALLPSSAHYRGVEVQRIFPRPVAISTIAHANVAAGTFGGTNLPQQDSALISIQTALSGRPFRGRLYIPFPSTSAIDSFAILTPSYMIKLNLLAAALLADINLTTGGRTASLRAVIYHRANTKAGLPLKDTVTLVTTFSTQNGIATQRRRGFYGKPNVSPV